MRRGNRSGVAQMQAQDKVLRKQLFVAIAFLFAIVAICCLNFKTYQPGRKVASDGKEVKVVEIENLKAENEGMQKAIKNLKRELASQKKKAQEAKTVEEVQPEQPQVASEKEEVSTAANIQ